MESPDKKATVISIEARKRTALRLKADLNALRNTKAAMKKTLDRRRSCYHLLTGGFGGAGFMALEHPRRGASLSMPGPGG
jgi:hypothetical protein